MLSHSLGSLGDIYISLNMAMSFSGLIVLVKMPTRTFCNLHVRIFVSMTLHDTEWLLNLQKGSVPLVLPLVLILNVSKVLRVLNVLNQDSEIEQ